MGRLSIALATSLRARVWLAIGCAAGMGAGLTLSLRIAGAGAGVAALAGAAAGLALVIALVAALMGRQAAVLDALAQGLSRFGERDYAVRIVEPRQAPLRRLVATFNALGHALRDERNTLYQKEMLLATVLEAASFAVVLCDEADLVVLANTAARDLFCDGGPLAGLRFGPLLQRVAPVPLREEGGLVTVDRGFGAEVLHEQVRTFELNTRRHTLYLFKSMTREMARQEVEVWKKTIRVISHELDNTLAPVSSLVHSARQILDRPEHADKLARVLTTIEERTTHLKGFLEGYARLARLPPPRPGPVEWAPFLEGVRAIYPFALQGEPPLQRGFFDAAQLQQVLINLLKNAIESGSPSDAIAVEVRGEPGGATRISVLDRGAGMTDETLRKAMMLFYSTKKRSSGLGLTLSREIVEAHGGMLSIERRDGGGTAVHVLLVAPSAGRDA